MDLAFSHENETTINKDYAAFFFSESAAWKHVIGLNGEFEIVPFSKLMNNRYHAVFVIKCNHLPPYMTRAFANVKSYPLPLYISADEPEEDEGEDLSDEDLDQEYQGKCQKADFDIKSEKEMDLN